LVTEAKRISNKRWDNAHSDRYQVLGCKVKRTDAELYKQAAERQHTNINTVLKQALDKLIENDLINKENNK